MGNIQEKIQEIKNSVPLNPEPIVLTEKAVDMVIEAAEGEGLKNWMLRIRVRGGGCSGLMNDIDFETEEPHEQDFVYEQQGSKKFIKVCIDPTSVSFLQGTVIQWTDGLKGSGFKFESPNFKRSCGCGQSFSY